ncbi:MAG: sulfotransferase [Geminicoccaceae bacterium]|nr:sulfotransferase [Geminicoccaceae bacterium]
MQKIFLVGSPRSGTTLLQTILTEQAGLHTLKETHYFRNLHRWRPLRALDRWRLDPKRVRAAFAFVRDNNPLETRFEPEGVRTLGDAVRALDTLLSAEAAVRGKRGWLEKTPEHMFFVDEVRAHVPGAKFVHILRDGEDVVASLFDAKAKYPAHWGWLGSLPDMVRLYNRYVRATRRDRGRGDTFVVRYDDLVERDRGMLDGLCRFLGVPPGGLDLARAASYRPEIVRAEEAWKVRSDAGVVDTRGQKFGRLFDRGQQDRIRRTLAPTADIRSG